MKFYCYYLHFIDDEALFLMITYVMCVYIHTYIEALKSILLYNIKFCFIYKAVLSYTVALRLVPMYIWLCVSISPLQSNIYKSDFILCYWCRSEVSIETPLIFPLLLITRCRVWGGNCGLRAYRTFKVFEEQNRVRDYQHTVLFVWNNILPVNEGSENKGKECGFEVY